MLENEIVEWLFEANREGNNFNFMSKKNKKMSFAVFHNPEDFRKIQGLSTLKILKLKFKTKDGYIYGRLMTTIGEAAALGSFDMIKNIDEFINGEELPKYETKTIKANDIETCEITTIGV